MDETAVIFIVLALGLTLMLIVIKFYPFKVSTVTKEFSMYYVLDLGKRKITTASLPSLKNDINKLFNEDYELIRIASLREFMKHETKLTENSILIAANESCIYTILKVFPLLLKQNISIIIFIPIFLLTNKFQEIQAALNQLISAEA